MRKVIALSALTLGLLAAPIAGASADTITQPPDASATINGGALLLGGAANNGTAPGTPSFPTVTLNGYDQTVTASLPGFTVVDGRGLHGTDADHGWNVTLQATQFTSDNGDTIPVGSLKLSAYSPTSVSSPAACDMNSTCSGTVSLFANTTPVSFDNPPNTYSNSVKVAWTSDGRGAFNVPTSGAGGVSLFIPADR